MMIHKALAVLAVTALSIPAVAQQYSTVDGNWGPEEGDWEFSIGGGGSSDEDVEVGDFSAQGELGYYLTDGLEVALRQSALYNDTGAGTTWSGASRVALDYHFSMFDERLRPFIGVNIGYIYGDRVDDTWGAGPEAGVKWYVKEETFIFGRAEYQFFFEDSDEFEDNFDDGNFIYTIGVGFNF